MIQIRHTTPGRLLKHLRKLSRDGEEILAQPTALSPAVELPWEVRVWRCLEKIAHPNAFDGAQQLDQADVGPVDLLKPKRRSEAEIDQLIRRRVRRRLVTLASVMEKVEAMAEAPARDPGKKR
jgi:hypothetical protein